MATQNRPADFSTITASTNITSAGNINSSGGVVFAGGTPASGSVAGELSTETGTGSGKLWFGIDGVAYIARITDTLLAICSHGAISLLVNGVQAFGASALGDWLVGGTSHLMFSVGTPTYSSGFGGSATITGVDYAFTVVPNSGATGTIAFGRTYTNPPVVSVTMMGTGAAGAPGITTTTTTLVIDTTHLGGFSTGYHVTVRGY